MPPPRSSSAVPDGSSSAVPGGPSSAVSEAAEDSAAAPARPRRARPWGRRPSARGGLLRAHRDFRLLWCGETAGKFGASVTSVAMPLLAVSALDATTFEVGLLGAASWFPWLCAGLPAGVLVDRVRRRPVMLVSAAAACLLLLTVPVAAATGHLGLGFLLAVSLLTGTATVFFQTAYTAYLPSLLAPEDQAEGNARLHGSASAAQISGLGSGGLISQAAGAAGGLLVNAATFAVSFVCLLGIRHREAPGPRSRLRPPDHPAPSLSGEIAEGLRLVAHDRWLRTFTVFGACSNLALMGYQSLTVVFLVREVGAGPGAVGALMAATGAGGIAGALLAGPLASRVGSARAVLLCELCLPTCALLIPLTDDGAGLLLYVAGGLGVSAGVVAGNVLKAGFQQRYCPPRLLGRLTASAAFLNYGTIPLGSLLGGGLGAALGVRAALWIMTAGVPLAALVLVFSPIGRVRELPMTPAPARQP